jgi:hypothetical protein
MSGVGGKKERVNGCDWECESDCKYNMAVYVCVFEKKCRMGVYVNVCLNVYVYAYV